MGRQAVSGARARRAGRARPRGRRAARERPGLSALRRESSRAQESRWQRAEAFAHSLHELLSRHAEDSRLHAPQNSALATEPGRNILNAAYLVPRKECEEFVELVDRTKDEEPGIRVELTGPWAAYSFVGEAAP